MVCHKLLVTFSTMRFPDLHCIEPLAQDRRTVQPLHRCAHCGCILAPALTLLHLGPISKTKPRMLVHHPPADRLANGRTIPGYRRLILHTQLNTSVRTRWESIISKFTYFMVDVWLYLWIWLATRGWRWMWKGIGSRPSSFLMKRSINTALMPLGLVLSFTTGQGGKECTSGESSDHCPWRYATYGWKWPS